MINTLIAICWPSSRTGGASQARVRLSVGADQRLALQSSPPSARRWDGLDSRERQGSVATGDVVIIDSLPALAFVHRRARARRCRKAPGRRPDGWCVAKQETFFGWRVHLVCRPDGVPVRVQMLPAGVHDLTTSPARGGIGGVRLACLPGRGCRAIKPTTAPLMRRASWRRRGRRSSCDQGRPCVRTPSVWTPSNCVRIAIRLRRSTVNRRR
jgi:hypothetical protein